jgi:hypothetical protein
MHSSIDQTDFLTRQRNSWISPWLVSRRSIVVLATAYPSAVWSLLSSRCFRTILNLTSDSANVSISSQVSSAGDARCFPTLVVCRKRLLAAISQQSPELILFAITSVALGPYATVAWCFQQSSVPCYITSSIGVTLTLRFLRIVDARFWPGSTVKYCPGCSQ